MPNDSIAKTLGVAAGVCVICSVLVSAASVALKERQERNKTLDKRTNILVAAGILEPGQSGNVDDLFRQIDARWVDVATGQFKDEKDLPPESLDERKAARDPATSVEIANDLAGIGRCPKFRQVFFTHEDGQKDAPIERIILPMHGKGLWSTMYGFLALDSDHKTIKNFAFYEHGETPGLGGEVDNENWKKTWKGKKAFNDDWEPEITVVKGKADPDSQYEVDGLSGATLTARGVHYLVQFWLGEEGYGPLLEKLRGGESDG